MLLVVYSLNAHHYIYRCSVSCWTHNPPIQASLGSMFAMTISSPFLRYWDVRQSLCLPSMVASRESKLWSSRLYNKYFIQQATTSTEIFPLVSWRSQVFYYSHKTLANKLLQCFLYPPCTKQTLTTKHFLSKEFTCQLWHHLGKLSDACLFQCVPFAQWTRQGDPHIPSIPPFSLPLSFWNRSELHIFTQHGALAWWETI